MNQTLQLLAAMLLGAATVTGGLLAGARVAGRPAKATERRLDRLQAISEAERSRLLALQLARSPSELALLLQTTPAPPPPPDQTLAGPLPPPAPREQGFGEYAADVNEVNEWGAEDDAAFARVRD